MADQVRFMKSRGQAGSLLLSANVVLDKKANEMYVSLVAEHAAPQNAQERLKVELKTARENYGRANEENERHKRRRTWLDRVQEEQAEKARAQSQGSARLQARERAVAS